MKNIFFAFLTIVVLFGACATEQTHQSFVDLNKIYNPDSLPKQTFTINPNSDTLLKGEQGTVLRIGKNTFVDSNGKPVTTPVMVELREVFTPYDMVMGNLTTTSNGAFLQSGGMLYINANTNGSDVRIADDKAIGATVTTDTVLPNMALYQGWPLVQSRHGDEPGDVNDTSSALNWKNPVPIEKQVPAAKVDSIPQQKVICDCNVQYTVDDYDSPPAEVTNYLYNYCAANKTFFIKKDSMFVFDKYVVNLTKREKYTLTENSIIPVKGENQFIEDANTSYIFSIKKLGWANIDRLYDNPKTQPVNLIVNVDGSNDFGLVYTTMLVDKMYLPGYQKKDKCYGFSHGDDEEMQLPVSEAATIIATAYKGNKVFFAMGKITLQTKQTVALKLEETTVAAMQAKLKANL